MTPNEPEMTGLRDFQRDTARYAFRRLFLDHDAVSRFLVADEVGLGKTIVARGVLTQAIEHLRRSGDDRVNIVYVASNAAIATQNLPKLVPPGASVKQYSERLSLLPFRLERLSSHDVNLVALTPQTSMDLRSSGGTFEERAAGFAALRTIWSGHRLRGDGLARIFAGAIREENGVSVEERLRVAADRWGSLPTEAAKIFTQGIRAVDARRAVAGRLDLDAEIHDLAPSFLRQPSEEIRQRGRLVIRDIREVLALTGVQLLEPDIVILDEFQRFKHLLDEDTSRWTSEIARAVFNYHHEEFNRTTRVLLLSATPYVMHTTSAEAAATSDVHYRDFLDTYRFLASGLPGVNAERAERDLRERLSAAWTSILDARMNGVEAVRDAFAVVSDQLKRVMVRTERLAVTPARDGMLREVKDPVGQPNPLSLRQYVGTAQVAAHVGADEVVEYWKSAPYTLSFLGGHDYRLTHEVRKRLRTPAPDIQLRELVVNSQATVPWVRIQSYQALDAANGRLATLWTDLFEAGAHRLLWLPPAAPYYATWGRYDTAEARRLTKRLVFSSWNVVPTVVSALTSYEAERRLTDEANRAGATTHPYDADSNTRHTRHLQFSTTTLSMTSLVLVLPSPSLAEIGDPLRVAAELRTDGVTPEIGDILATVRRRVAEAIGPLVAERNRTAAGSGSLWYTLAPMLLDLGRSDFDPNTVQAAWFRGEDASEVGGLTQHLDSLRAACQPDAVLPDVPDDLEDVLALSAVAGPPAVLLRSLGRHFGEVGMAALAKAAAAAAWGMRTLLNSFEATLIIDANGPRDVDFWRKALAYCAEGHLQAVLDEYVAALVEWQGYDRKDDRLDALTATAADLTGAMSMRTSNYMVLAVRDGEVHHEDRMRARFAVRFGNATDEDGREQRVESVRLAFNSPFWPFVVTTTSIGQEGLDFHLYCHAVTHWNLPHNPVELEQREGRVHRYKGHAVRKNVANAVGPPTGQTEPWAEMFDRATRIAGNGGSEIVPYWVFAPDGMGSQPLAHIERHLPISPYSREASVLPALLASVAHYRLAFGQPRQEELLHHVLYGIDDERLRAELLNIRVDLSPPRVHRRA